LIGTIQTNNSDPTTRWHFPGNVPATTALRILLTHHGECFAGLSWGRTVCAPANLFLESCSTMSTTLNVLHSQ
ncbi:MAG: hypothetical protein ACRD82_21260, partial [Blastocatellia bacterium]